MQRYYYSASISTFLEVSSTEIIGTLTQNSDFDVSQDQRQAWLNEIALLRDALVGCDGYLYLEYSIPRMGSRIDAVLIIDSLVFVIEFKVGEKKYPAYAFDQVWDYALDLKNFHETSHDKFIAPVLVATEAKPMKSMPALALSSDKLFSPLNCNGTELGAVLESVRNSSQGNLIDIVAWEQGKYLPTPTIIEAARALYNGHAVEDISRNDAGAQNLALTSKRLTEIIDYSQKNSKKSICFVTGVPGAGKTLVGLDIANKHMDSDEDLYSVFLSGNGPLVAVLREALICDKVQREKGQGNSCTKKMVSGSVKAFIQNVHHFRDECLNDLDAPPEHVTLFDEAQRAWNIDQTTKFMKQKKHIDNFNMSEPEFLISCMDRHEDWAVIICLVGGGQEINTGEAGIAEWINALIKSYLHWDLYITSQLEDAEYSALGAIRSKELLNEKFYDDRLHLAVSMRSFRAESVSLFVKQVLDIDSAAAKETLTNIRKEYPVVLTRDLTEAKQWLKKQARGSERYGIVVSSQAERLKPYAIDVRPNVNPVHWFLKDKDDVRSSYYLEDVATEFHIQGLELDWVCVTWDADLRFNGIDWEYWSFKGSKWQHIRKEQRQLYLKNAYRVLLTRARQGMVIVVPEGDDEDKTRKHIYYDKTFSYLKEIGIPCL